MSVSPSPRLFACAFALLFTATSSARAADADGAADKSGAPYFFVPGADPGVDALPLKETRADIAIAGVIAHVRVTQVYKNEGDKPLEAQYVFPGSTRAAVFAMQMQVGERRIVARIEDKDAARKLYEDAKTEGKTASLLEQQRPNVFQMNVANILPGDTVRVELDYAELIVPDGGTYELVYPAVVGPRYVGESDRREGYAETPYHREGEAARYGWDVAVRLAAGMPVKRVTSPSHPITTQLTEPGIADVTLVDKGAAGTKDFVLQYQLAGKAIETGVLLLPGATPQDESFFLAMVQPPAVVAPAARPKREYVFIVDVSGSMGGFPLDTAKLVMNRLLDGMNEGDLFNILCFSGGNLVLAPQSLPVTADNVGRAKRFMGAMQGGGGTEILGALRQALAMPTAHSYARTFVAVTDGYVTVEPEVFETIRGNLGEANFFAFGIGSSVNRHLIEGMARMGMGEPFFVMQGDDAAEKAARFAAMIDSPALTDIAVAFDGFDAYDVEPAAPPDLFASRPVLVFGKYRGAAKGRVVVSGVGGEGAFRQALDVGKSAPSGKNEALRYLWARHRIATLGDFMAHTRGDRAAMADEVKQLGLRYHLMTAYTSFVAIDERVRNRGGDNTTVRQPLPLPAGVGDAAVPEAPLATAVPMQPMLMPAPAREASGVTRGLAGATMDAEEIDVLERPRVAREPRPSPPAKLAPPRTAATKVRVSAVSVVVGPRAAKDLEARLEQVAATFVSCLGDNARAGGWVEIELTIAADGTVTAAVVKGSNDDGGAVSPSAAAGGAGACMARRSRAATFAALAAGSAATIVRVVVALEG